MQEFPYSPSDQEHGWLYRHMMSQIKIDPTVTEWTIDNFLYLGQRNLSAGPNVFQQVTRRTKDVANGLCKPIVYGPAVASPEVVSAAVFVHVSCACVLIAVICLALCAELFLL